MRGCQLASLRSCVARNVDAVGKGLCLVSGADSCRKVIAFIVVVVIGLGGLAHCLHAELPDGVSHWQRFPIKNGAAKFSTAVGFTDFSGVGYQPVEIVFTSPIATSSDIRLNYRIANTLATQTPDDNLISVDIPIFVPQGTKTKRWVRYLPKWMMGNGYEVVISQDGRALPGFQGSVAVGPAYYRLGDYLNWERQAAAELKLEMLLITPDELSPAEARLLNFQRNPEDWSFAVRRPWIANDAQVMGGFPAAAFGCGTGNLPKDWRGYQRWDVVVLTKATIADLKSRQVEWKALLGWALCGGTLIVWDVESQTELGSLFDRTTTESGLTSKQIYSLGFSETDFYRAGMRVTASGKLETLTSEPGSEGSGKDAASTGASPRFFGVALGAGKAIAVSGISASVSQVDVTANGDKSILSDAGLLNFPKWSFYVKLMREDVSSVLRRGAEPILGNMEYKKWLVPGVAQPPVYTLVAFLTIFVVLVGPVAYRRTTRSGRGHLMFVIAPLLALVTTVSMFAYGLVVDGFSTLGRIRQITWVDGATGAAGERVRETYFAPISPDAGLVFPGDAEVFSVRRPDFESWDSRHNSPAKSLGSVKITDKMQRFSSSFLPSREQRQFVSYRPRFDTGRLTLAPDRVKDTQCQVTNDFKFRIQDAVVCDRDGTYRRLQNVGAGQSQVAVVLNAADAGQLIGKYYLDHSPIATNGSQIRRGRSWRGGVKDLTAELGAALSDGSGSVRSTEGRFEIWLRETLQINNELPPGFFVAVCDVTQDVAAVEGCEIDNSVHYVIGTLP